ncbi:flp pilus-assembly TadE/G-like family protein, partial [Streptomyces kunmingensis]
ALAAAEHWSEGRAAACALAGRVARAQGATIARCSVAGEVSDVTASAGTGPFATRVRARAGPAGPLVPGSSPVSAPPRSPPLSGDLRG